MELKAASDALNLYLRPQTFPLAIGMVGKGEEVPSRARWPKRDLGLTIPVCQAVGIARRYGWTIAMGAEDQLCPYGALTLGFCPPKGGFLSGEYPGPFRSQEQAQAAHNSIPRLEYGRYQAVVLSPLANATFEPHLVVIYGNSAQVMRLVQGAVFLRGGVVSGVATGGMDCADIITQTILSQECHFILPCNGDRIFGLTQDDEMAFTIPARRLEDTMKGLEEGHKSGLQRYPIPSFLRFQPQMPERYNQLMEYLRQG